MPLYQVDVEKQVGGEYWSNRYLFNVASLTEAAGKMTAIVDAEAPLYHPDVRITKARASDFNPLTDNYSVVQYARAGGRSAGSLAPLFNVVRIDFNTGSGRPSRKYLRGVLFTGNLAPNFQVDPNLSPALSAYGTAILGLVGFCDPQMQAFTNAQVHPYVAMRQLRRGTKRKLKPII